MAQTAAIVLAAIATATWRTDPDLWGHLRFGLDIVRDRSLASVDPYSFTSDVPWINHEWLSEAVMGLAYRMGGTIGLLALKIVLAGSAYLLIGWRLRHVAPLQRWWLIAVAVLATMPLTTTLRPQLWTVLALSAITATVHWPMRRLFPAWPLVFAIWANAHGGWIVGLAVVGAWGVGAVLDRERGVVPVAGLILCCVAATLVTPYGIELWRFVWTTVGLGRDIVEWRPVWETNVWILAIWCVVALTTIAALRRAAWTWATLLPVLLLGGVSFKVIRLIGLFAIVAANLLGSRFPQHRQAVHTPTALALSLLIAAFLPAGFAVARQVQCVPVQGQDPQAVGALMHAQPGKLMVPFGFGQYAIWHLAPALKVSMDGRRETVYSAEQIDRQLQLDHGEPGILPVIDAEAPEYVWLYAHTAAPLIEPLTSRGYRIDHRTKYSVVLVRSDLPALPSGDVGSCFP